MFDDRNYKTMEGYIFVNKSVPEYIVGQRETDYTMFSSSLSRLFHWNNLSVGTYYKIRAYNPELRMISAGGYNYTCQMFEVVKKLTWDDISSYILNNFTMIESKKEYKQACKMGYRLFSKDKFIKKAIELGYSVDFAEMIFPSSDYRTWYDRLITLTKEGISKETIVSIFLKK